MHYVPESARELLPDDLGDAGADRERSFHYQSAPIYALTALVGLLLAADLLLSLIGDPAWLAYRTPLGYRLALLAAVAGGARILYQTLDGLFDGRVGADLALTIAALAAIILGEHVTAALVVFVALCGESIEGFTVDRAQQAIRRIFNLYPPVAHVFRAGQERDVPVDEVEVGDVALIRPGERIPVDGKVTEGSSAVDQSALTGESVPVEKGVGDEVFTGTLNRFGSLTVTAEKVGSETTLAQVIQLVAEASERKAPLERTADRLARLFLPFVLAAAGLTLIAWRFYAGEWSDGFQPMLGVLVVACPCPLVLATPTAVMAAMAWLARTGVVVKGSQALERLANVDSFAFDKTGTLTRGELTLGSVHAFSPLDETELLRVAAIAERHSEHLLGRLIVREAEARNVVVPHLDDFEAHPGSGVVASVRGTALGPWIADVPHLDETNATEERRCQVIVGSRRLLEAQEVDIPADIETSLLDLDESGQTPLLVAVDQSVLGVIGVLDTIRPESREVIAALREADIEHFSLLTGDRNQPANAVAASLGFVDEVVAEMLPADKANWIQQQTKQGRRIAMVGDGVNDAPALATATVGLALGGVGSDIAAEAGDLVLMGDPLKPLPGLLRLARQLVQNIRQSIFIFAFGMNFLGMLLCAVGILSPVAGAVFHEFSSLAVMLNAMRLLWFERWDETRLGRLSEWFQQSGQWISETFSPTRSVYRLIDNWALLVQLAVLCLAFYWLQSGIVLLSEDERAVVTRYGRFESELTAGLHVRWPRPFERVERERTDRVRTVQIGFRAPEPSEELSDSPIALIEWTSEHVAPGFESRPRESLLLTGDEVPVELTAVVHYRIDDLQGYVYGSAGPVAMLRAAAESSIREVAARTSLDGMLTDERAGIERRCLALMSERIEHYRLGIEVTDLNLLDIHPPLAVVPAYRDVANAMEEKEQQVNEAEAYYTRKVLAAAGERAIRMLSQPTPAANGQGSSSTTGGISDWKLDDENWGQLTRESEEGILPLSGEAAATLLLAHQERVKRVESARGAAARFEHLLGAYRHNQLLTGLQLYWQTIEETLASRPLTIVDPEASGRQHLLLVDPDRLGGGLPMLERSLSNDAPDRQFLAPQRLEEEH